MSFQQVNWQHSISRPLLKYLPLTIHAVDHGFLRRVCWQIASWPQNKFKPLRGNLSSRAPRTGEGRRAGQVVPTMIKTSGELVNPWGNCAWNALDAQVFPSARAVTTCRPMGGCHVRGQTCVEICKKNHTEHQLQKIDISSVVEGGFGLVFGDSRDPSGCELNGAVH